MDQFNSVCGNMFQDQDEGGVVIQVFDRIEKVSGLAYFQKNNHLYLKKQSHCLQIQSRVKQHNGNRPLKQNRRMQNGRSELSSRRDSLRQSATTARDRTGNREKDLNRHMYSRDQWECKRDCVYLPTKSNVKPALRLKEQNLQRQKYVHDQLNNILKGIQSEVKEKRKFR